MKFLSTFMPLLLATAACLAQDVRYNFDKGADFSKYKTYKWVQIQGTPPLNQLVDQQLKEAIDAGLASKGLTKSTGEEADLWVAYQFAVGQEKEMTSYGSDFGYGPGWGRGWYGGTGSSMTTTTTSTIHVGEMALDIYDPAKKQIVWRGAATKTLDPKAKPEKKQKNLAKGVTKLLKNFPPPPGKNS